MAAESEDGKELEKGSYLAIGAVLGLAAAIGLTLLVLVVINTASSVKDAVSPPTLVPAAAAETPTGSESDTPTSLGMELATSKGCVACHSTNGSDGAGPTWSGVFGSERALDDGSTVTADDDYLLESIVDPGAKVVDGFAPIMPGSFGNSLSEEELDALVTYIKSV